MSIPVIIGFVYALYIYRKHKFKNHKHITMPKKLLVPFSEDSYCTVSIETWQTVSQKLKMTETAAIHYAMAKVAGEQIKDFPFYDTPDHVVLKGYDRPRESISKLDASYFEDME
jgi:hypothetical protein